MEDKNIIITKNKELIRDIIFKDDDKEAIKLCKVLKEYGIYEGFAGFGLYLSQARHIRGNTKIEQEIAKKLQDILDGEKEETNRVWVILQTVMLWMAGGAPKKFKEALE